jgi:hypothetical protein
MDKICINNLFKGADFKPLDVHTLYDIKGNKDKEKFNLNIDRLIHLRDERENRVMVQYEKVYNTCLSKITTANELNKTSVVFNVPETVYGYFNYSPSECIKHINAELAKEKFDTLVVNDTTIYISWLNLGKNREKVAENKDKDKQESTDSHTK